MGSTLEGKNLLLREQILSCKSWPPLAYRGKNQNGRVDSPESVPIHLNPTALRKAKIVCNFGLSECNMVKTDFHISLTQIFTAEYLSFS